MLLLAFMDLRTAFDSLPGQRLWDKLKESSIDECLLLLFQHLYDQPTVQVRCGPSGRLTRAIALSKGVKQVSILITFI